MTTHDLLANELLKDEDRIKVVRPLAGRIMRRRSKHPELIELAYAGLAAIRRWEEENEKTETEHPAGNHLHGNARRSPGDGGHGLTGSNDPDHSSAAGHCLDRAFH